MAEWWRSWHGAPTDAKWRVVAKRANAPVHLVVAVAWALMDRASANATERGRTDGFDAEVLADFLDADEADIRRIVAAMHDKGILVDGRFAAWEKRQAKREDDSAARAKAWREKKKSEAFANAQSDDGTPDNAPRTHANARERTRTKATAREEKSREEENREEKKESHYATPLGETSHAHAREDRSPPPDGGGGAAQGDFEFLVEQVFEASGIDPSRRSPRTDAWLAKWAERLSHAAILEVVNDRTRAIRATGDAPKTLAAFNEGLGRAVEARTATVHRLDTLGIVRGALKAMPGRTAE